MRSELHISLIVDSDGRTRDRRACGDKEGLITATIGTFKRHHMKEVSKPEARWPNSASCTTCVKTKLVSYPSASASRRHGPSKPSLLSFTAQNDGASVHRCRPCYYAPRDSVLRRGFNWVRVERSLFLGEQIGTVGATRTPRVRRKRDCRVAQKRSRRGRRRIEAPKPAFEFFPLGSMTKVSSTTLQSGVQLDSLVVCTSARFLRYLIVLQGEAVACAKCIPTRDNASPRHERLSRSLDMRPLARRPFY